MLFRSKMFTVELSVYAFGPNVGRPIPVRIGDIEKALIITNRRQPDTYRLQFTTDGTVHTVEITPPRPASPNELDPRAADVRKLGIAFFSLKIRTRP